MIYAVTGRVWNAATRKHDKLQTIEFERRYEAESFMNINREWIAGMVMDRDAEAIEADKSREFDQAKARGEYRLAGRLARLAGRDADYGCHYGMRSELSFAREEYRAGWLEIDTAIANGWKDQNGDSLLSDETDENGIPS